MLKSLQAQLARERRSLTAVKAKVSSKGLLLAVCLKTFGAAISHTIVKHFQIRVFFNRCCIDYFCNTVCFKC